MSQNPRNQVSKLNNVGGGASPMSVKGKPAVAGGQGRNLDSGNNAATPSYGQATAGAAKVRSGNLKNPGGVNLGTFHGKHNVAHPMQSPTGDATNSIQQGK